MSNLDLKVKESTGENSLRDELFWLGGRLLHL
jgi:hypothetical protein